MAVAGLPMVFVAPNWTFLVALTMEFVVPNLYFSLAWADAMSLLAEPEELVSPADMVLVTSRMRCVKEDVSEDPHRLNLR